ncbi:MAG TPA: hypothetical protein ENN61_00260, partial [Bacteroidaceae bacterium]|nr:hypothetical protein [Bacteroidaceae bacterium]
MRAKGQMKYIPGWIFLMIIMSGQVLAHSGQPKYHVIIDTDGGIDDMRAISMLLAGNDIRVLAVNCSRGTLMPRTVFSKVHSLLSAFHHEGIPVGISRETDPDLPEWADFAKNIHWGNPLNHSSLDENNNAVDILNSVTENYPDRITLVALGSLKTYADWFRVNPDIVQKIERIIWYNHPETQRGFNYQLSPGSYEFIRNSAVSIETVANLSDNLTVNDTYLSTMQHVKSVYADQILYVHAQKPVKERIKQDPMYLWDDMVPLYLTLPLLFDIESRDGITYASIMPELPRDFVYETISKLLGSATSASNRVFIEFPVDTALYLPEYAKMVNTTIEQYGLVEWKAISLTNEIHGHTGIYSIIGAKMGIRAMEYFNVGINNMKVVTFAGNDPPLSCFNDGIQISTGATIGQGLIMISDSISTIPSAIFT